MSSDSWRNFASSSYQSNNNNPHHHFSGTATTPSFPLRDALSTSHNNNNSNVSGGGGAKASFFVANKSNALSPTNKSGSSEFPLSAATTGYSPPKKIQSLPQPPTQQHQASSSIDNLRDIALKHLFTADAAASNAAESFLSPTGKQNSKSPSSGLTPLKTAPLRLGLRRRLGMTIMSQGAHQQQQQHGENQQQHEEEGDEDEGRSSMLRELESESREAADVLKSIGARALLKKDIPVLTSAAAAANDSQLLGSDLLRQRRKKQQQKQKQQQQQQQQVAAADFTQPSYTVTPTATPGKEAQQEEGEQQQPKQQQQNPVSLAAMAKIRNMLHEPEAAAAAAAAQPPQQHYQQEKEDDADVSGEFHIVGTQQQQQQQKSFHGVEKRQNNGNNNDKKKKQQQPLSLVDRTGDFRTPLVRARDALQRCMSDFGMDLSQPDALDLHKSRKAPNASATCRFLESKFETLHGVAMQLELEENRMRTATAAVLAELVGLKKLEQAAKAEALTWLDYEAATDEEEDYLHAKGAAMAAESFLMELE